MLAIARRVHLATAWLFAAGVLVQGYLAGTAIAELGGSGNFGLHVSVGYTVMGVLAICVPIFALLGRLPRSQVGLSLILLILYVVQTSLPYARASSPEIAALHPAVAMVLLGLAPDAAG
jgi:Family of unknown function (DUF6220)